ncbi:MAG TPA: recombinase RecT [Anaerolineaceae bacterium]|nr:recombinase RecT [Anaerolineaceae bacterium]
MSNQAITNTQDTQMSRIKSYMLSPEVKERFSEMMGQSGIYYLNQVLIVVANSPELQKCEPKSILVSAMRAASLKLNVDPSSGQAWIIPYQGKATFQLGYKGVYELALRTNQYRFINVITIYEGEDVVENRMTGLQVIAGQRTSDKVIGYMLYFQLVKGYEKTFYMTLQEIDAHAKKYSKSYSFSKSPWNDPVERPKMEKKTVLVNGLRRWGRFNQGDADILDEIEAEQGWTGADDLPEPGEVTVEKPAKKTADQILNELNPDWGSKATPAADEPETIDGEFEDQAPAPAAAWTSTVISLEIAQSEKASDGALYWGMKTEDLVNRLNSIQKTLDKNHMDDAKRDTYLLKRDVIKAILQYRSQPEQSPAEQDELF